MESLTKIMVGLQNKFSRSYVDQEYICGVFCQNSFGDLDAVYRHRDTFYKTLFWAQGTQKRIFLPKLNIDFLYGHYNKLY